MKRLLVFILGVVMAMSLTACSDETMVELNEMPTLEADGALEWAVYWYLCGSDLESEYGAATEDLLEMMAVELPENVKVIIQTGGADVWQNDIIDEDKSQRYVYDSEGLHLIEEKPSENMGDTQTLIDFLEFSKENYPANSIENYGGNTRKQGFTNMADLGHLVKKSASLLPESYKDVISALEACIL